MSVSSRTGWGPGFGMACLIEGALVGVALGLGVLLGVDPWRSWSWSGSAVGWGLVGLGPPLCLLGWLSASTWPPVVRMRDRTEAVLKPWLGRWPVWQMGVLSLVAGLGEETLFRGVVQAAASGWLGEVGALCLAAALFGLAHPITRLYALLAGAMGAWFGLVWYWSGNLLAPVSAHAAYDFVALVWWLRIRRSSGQAA